MVSRQINSRSNYDEAKQAYETARAKLLDHVLMSEYLDLLEVINEDIALIQSIIEDDINHDLD